MGWKRISRHRTFQKVMSLFGAKDRDSVHTERTAGQAPYRRGRVDVFHGLGAGDLKGDSCCKAGIR